MQRDRFYGLRWLGLYVLLVIVLLPHFVNILRMVQFDVIPRDHYYNILLRMINVNQDGSFFGGAPFGYRVLNILLAAPFYVVPPFLFRHLPDQTSYTIEQLRASQAIVITNYLCIVAVVVLATYMVYRIHKRSSSEAILAGILAFIFLFFSGWYSLDMPVVLYICIVLYTLHKAAVTIPLLLVSSVFNEKIWIVFGLLFVIRLLTPSIDKKRSLYYFLASVAAGVIYYIMVRLVGNPFPEHQAYASRYAAVFWHNAVTSFSSVRGLIVNTLPISLLVALAMLHTRSLRIASPWMAKRYHFCYQRYDYLLVFAYLAVCMVASAQFNLGRLITILFPFYLFGAASQIQAYFNRTESLIT